MYDPLSSQDDLPHTEEDLAELLEMDIAFGPFTVKAPGEAKATPPASPRRREVPVTELQLDLLDLTWEARDLAAEAAGYCGGVASEDIASRIELAVQCLAASDGIAYALRGDHGMHPIEALSYVTALSGLQRRLAGRGMSHNEDDCGGSQQP